MDPLFTVRHLSKDDRALVSVKKRHLSLGGDYRVVCTYLIANTTG